MPRISASTQYSDLAATIGDGKEHFSHAATLRNIITVVPALATLATLTTLATGRDRQIPNHVIDAGLVQHYHNRYLLLRAVNSYHLA